MAKLINDQLAAITNATVVPLNVWEDYDLVEHGKLIMNQLTEAGFIVLSKQDWEIFARTYTLSHLYLNIGSCPKCELPRDSGLICPCGYDGVD